MLTVREQTISDKVRDYDDFWPPVFDNGIVQKGLPRLAANFLRLCSWRL